MTAGVAMNLTGRKFGKWTVMRRVPGIPPHFRGRWMCRCSCGTERVIYAHSLVGGISRSCGCSRLGASLVTWRARRERQDLLERALAFIDHKAGCQLLEWSDPADHITTSFGFVITSEKCTCGAIALACQLDPTSAARVASDGSNPEELSCTR